MAIEDETIIRKILMETKTVAVVGASPKPGRDSGRIMDYLIRRGYEVIPVNPMYDEVLGQVCYPNLKSLPKRIDLVDIFRRSEEVLPIVKEAVQIGAKTVWMQLGVVQREAGALAEKAGLQVVMDRCIAIEHQHLIG